LLDILIDILIYQIDVYKFHVPIFLLISFYFYYNTIKTKNITKINQRFLRISLPYIFWPTFMFINNNILFKVFRFSQYNKLLELKKLLLQLILGSNYHYIFYFQFNLIFLTLLFTIISIFFKICFIFLFQILLIVAYILQYSYWNLYIFNKYNSDIQISIGHIFELLPFAVMGLTLRYLDIIAKLKKYKELANFYCTIIIFLILKFNIFVRIKGYWFPGIFLNIGAICIFIIFSLFHFQNIKITFLLKLITKFTGGIYYIHMIYFHFLKRKILFIKNMTFHGSIVIYVISYITCYLGNKFSYKTKYKLLFN